MSDAVPGAGRWRRVFKIGPKRPDQAAGLDHLGRAMEALVEGRPAVLMAFSPDQVAAVTGLVGVLQGCDDAVVQLGSLVAVKHGDRLRVHCFTEAEAVHLQRHPQVLDSAAALVDLIDGLLPPDDRPRGKHRRPAG